MHIDIHENIHLSIYKEKIYLYIYYTTLVRSWSTPFSFGVPFRQDKAFPESPGEDIEEKEPAAWDALDQHEEQEEGQHEEQEEGQDDKEEERQDGEEEEKKQDGEEEKKQHDELQEVEWQEWDPEPDETRLRNRKEWPLVFRPKPPPKKFQPKKMPRPSDGGGKKDEKKKDEKKKDERKKDEKKKDEKKKDERNKEDGKKGGVGGWKFPPPPPKPIGRKGEVAAVVKGPQQPTFPPPPPKPDKTMAEIPPRPPPVPVKKKPALPAPPRPPPAPVPKVVAKPKVVPPPPKRKREKEKEEEKIGGKGGGNDEGKKNEGERNDEGKKKDEGERNDEGKKNDEGEEERRTKRSKGAPAPSELPPGAIPCRAGGYYLAGGKGYVDGDGVFHPYLGEKQGNKKT